MTLPTLAVVGHPNKGKSSIVATLAEDARIYIDVNPGATQHAQHVTVQVDGQPLYVLVDTPGFERPNQAWRWLNEQQPAADQRAATVARFVQTFAGQPKFAHECELLAPVIDGAGVLYVVDGSVPFGPDYEAEMEILRWTGQPRMALINPIGSADYIDEWQRALRQYFDMVQVFDATDAPFARRIAMLEAIAHLRDDWRQPLREAVRRLTIRREDQHRQAAQAIARMVADMVGKTCEKLLASDQDPKRHESQLAAELREKLREREQLGRREVEAIYAHHRMNRSEPRMPEVDADLFNTSHWYLFGLTRAQLAAGSAAGGAVIGGVVDAGLGGASFMLGSLIGAAVGGATAWLGAHRLETVRILHQPLGGRRLIAGPVASANFAYVVLGRALAHHRVVAARTHADQQPLAVAQDAQASHWIDPLDPAARRTLEKTLMSFRRQRHDHERIETVARIIVGLLGDPRGEIVS